MRSFAKNFNTFENAQLLIEGERLEAKVRVRTRRDIEARNSEAKMAREDTEYA